MPKGWSRATSGDKRNISVPFECEECGNEWVGTGTCGMTKITKRLLSGTMYKWSMQCPACGAFCKTEVDEHTEPAGKRPTKRVIVGQNEYKFFGRDRNAYPADLAEVVERTNQMFEEQRNGSQERTDHAGACEEVVGEGTD